jgi:hypothetical protein
MHAWRSTLHYLHIACWSHGGGGGSTAAPAVVLPHTPLAWLPICLSPCLPACLLQETKELLQQHAAAVRANDRLRTQAGVRERAAEEVARDIEMAQIEREKLLAEQVTWDLEVGAGHWGGVDR